MNRIIMHWTAGTGAVSPLDRKHYHEIVAADGSRVLGDKLPEANASTADGHYAAHTRALNTGSIGLAMAGMAGARDRPFDAGGHPLTERQLAVFIDMVAEYADTYQIPVTRETILTHAEVQPTLGVAQRGKWDITWLPGMDETGDPIGIGDFFRRSVDDSLYALGSQASFTPHLFAEPTKDAIRNHLTAITALIEGE